MTARVARALIAVGLGASLQSGAGAAGRAVPPDAPEHQVEGLWSYHAIAPKGRPVMAVDGLFVFREARFVQQSLNKGEPFDRQVAQGHAGTYRRVGAAVDQVAEVGLIIDPGRTPAINLRRNGEHHITVARAGDDLTLTFSSGTVQTFSRVGPADGRIYPLDRGALALVDGRFLLVAETGDRVVEGSGRFERSGTTLTLRADRWVSNKTGEVVYGRGVTVTAGFDGRRLTLPGEPMFKVTE
jgi:hypothetical protein